ncbi:MAG: hypothetical protein QG641_468, partial [Candidatus Poribacteria bacterium]|nr:hypothetical protein [Candidatus Poribacteria bacterium]
MKKFDDNMDKLYKENPEHYDTGLIKIGLSEKQARGYSSYFRSIRDYYYDKIEKTYKECIKDKSEIYILDVGSGLGEDAHALNRIVPNAKIYGIEVSKEAVSICQNQAKNNMIFIHGSITEPQCNNFQPNSFDIITNFTTLEHVGDPEKMIEICSYLLKPGGLLISAVPNH